LVKYGVIYYFVAFPKQKAENPAWNLVYYRSIYVCTCDSLWKNLPKHGHWFLFSFLYLQNL